LKMWVISDSKDADHSDPPLLEACFFDFSNLHHTALGQI